MDTHLERTRELARRKGVLRPSDLSKRHLPRDYLFRLHRRGELVWVGLGLYACVEDGITEHHSLVEAVTGVPNSVVCLLSALRFHGRTTQNPYEVWPAGLRVPHLAPSRRGGGREPLTRLWGPCS